MLPDLSQSIERFYWLVRGCSDVWPAYVYLAVLPIASINGGRVAIGRAILAVLAAQVGPFLGLAWASLAAGEQEHAFSFVAVISYLFWMLGILTVIAAVQPLRTTTPYWARILFAVGVVALHGMSVFLGGMTLTGDWI
jgi:hypothetical protein